MKKGLWIGLLGAAAAVAAWLVWTSGQPEVDAPASVAQSTPLAAPTASPAPVLATPASAPAALPVPAPASTAITVPADSAAVSMAHARQHGDERTPPIAAATPEDSVPQPTPWELSDPMRYQDYEQRQQRRVQEQYLRAAERELPAWRAALAQARANGASEADLAAGEEKIRRLEAIQAKLRAAAAASAPAGP